MATAEQRRAITVGETDAGEAYDLPVEDLLTGRLFLTGKSGSGKSNSASVIVEELLERGHPCLIVDTDGEYWGLKEEFEILHVGATEECDLQVGAEHAGKLAELALEQHVPIVLDVSGYLESDDADAIVREVATELFAREQEAQQPFLLLVEEIHEYLPQSGAVDETGRVLTRIAKRGRKRGLGLAGISQRPSSVDKDFITQADLLVWHRLTWDNDTKVVARVLDRDHADRITDLDDGQAFVQADWRESDVDVVQFRRKRTFDAGATPGLDDVDRPELKSIGEDLVDELDAISDAHERRQDRIAELEATIEAKDEEIASLEAELERLKTADETLDLLTSRLQGGGDAGGAVPDDVQEQLAAKNETIADLRERVDALEEEREALLDDMADLEAEVERLRGIEERVEQAEAIEEQLERARDVLSVDVQESGAAAGAETAALEERIAELEAENERLREENGAAPNDLMAMVEHDAVQAAVDTAKEKSDRGGRHFDRTLAILANAEDGGPLSVDEIEPLTDVSDSTIRKVCQSLHQAGVVQTEKNGRSTAYALDRDFLETRIEVAEQQAAAKS